MLEGLLGGTFSWAAVILGVGLLIFIHEAGHFLVAKWAGVKVLAFSLGFGPVLWGFQRGDTHYRISWIPLGGYVKMSGENELPEGGYAPDDYPSKSVGVRALIIAAGVIMNAVLGFALFA
ncbi:MAG: site-2 protease family protein, partial [Planctomycetota bacterium]